MWRQQTHISCCTCCGGGRDEGRRLRRQIRGRRSAARLRRRRARLGVARGGWPVAPRARVRGAAHGRARVACARIACRGARQRYAFVYPKCISQMHQTHVVARMAGGAAVGAAFAALGATLVGDAMRLRAALCRLLPAEPPPVRVRAADATADISARVSGPAPVPSPASASAHPRGDPAGVVVTPLLTSGTPAVGSNDVRTIVAGTGVGVGVMVTSGATVSTGGKPVPEAAVQHAISASQSGALAPSVPTVEVGAAAASATAVMSHRVSGPAPVSSATSSSTRHQGDPASAGAPREIAAGSASRVNAAGGVSTSGPASQGSRGVARVSIGTEASAASPVVAQGASVPRGGRPPATVLTAASAESSHHPGVVATPLLPSGTPAVGGNDVRAFIAGTVVGVGVMVTSGATVSTGGQPFPGATVQPALLASQSSTLAPSVPTADVGEAAASAHVLPALPALAFSDPASVRRSEAAGADGARPRHAGTQDDDARRRDHTADYSGDEYPFPDPGGALSRDAPPSARARDDGLSSARTAHSEDGEAAAFSAALAAIRASRTAAPEVASTGAAQSRAGAAGESAHALSAGPSAHDTVPEFVSARVDAGGARGTAPEAHVGRAPDSRSPVVEGADGDVEPMCVVMSTFVSSTETAAPVQHVAPVGARAVDGGLVSADGTSLSGAT